jgi:hypothetical protein
MSTWFVTFHGGDGKDSFNNIHTYTTNGKQANPEHALAKSSDADPDELRGFITDADGNLYVVNANRPLSQVLLYAPPESSAGQYTFQRVFAHDGLDHPFDLEFGPDGDLYVSSQDTNEVTVYVGPNRPSPDAPAPGTFEKTFISGQDTLRGIACDGSTWYIANAGSDVVRMYGLDGQEQATSITVKEPIHLLYDGRRYLYIGSEKENAVFLFDTQNPGDQTDNHFTPIPFITGGTPSIDKTAGLALPGDGHFYVASRKGKQILRYKIEDTTPPTTDPAKVHVLVDNLKDEPEFLTLMP